MQAVVAQQDLRRGPFRRARSGLHRISGTRGRGLIRFATWCALAEHYGPRTDDWPDRLGKPKKLARAIAKRADRIDFHCWLQWICDQQLAAAGTAATDSGMAIG